MNPANPTSSLNPMNPMSPMNSRGGTWVDLLMFIGIAVGLLIGVWVWSEWPPRWFR